MIGWFAKLLGINKWIVSAITALALVGAIGLGAWWIHGTIYDSGYQAASAVKNAEIAELKEDFAKQRAAAVEARNAEVERQAAANNAAKTREAARIAEMQAQTEILQSQIEELQREASEDPDAGRTALGASSVQRVNKVR
ncbi:hypothetical protein FHX10_003245 [Rhizobium sp. BK591]|uniref:hypothetical protein n=1 Tax=Rhizobium sp. BK591 TaxID=2586985 RepID=UPI00160BCCE3|nr:hypothetical protein [Rhizobium sp. BK591]MBB3743746.1 hypothetical protein [Rhizobium sp. BK591]